MITPLHPPDSNGERPLVLITGGVRRLGFLLSTYCLRSGFDLLLPTRCFNGSDMDEWLQLNPTASHRVHIFHCDFSHNFSPLENCFKTTPVTGLISAAALFAPDNPADISLPERLRYINTAIPLALTHLLAENSTGTWAVHISDALIRKGNSCFEGYRESKRELEGSCGELAELYRGKLRINCIAPGPVISRGPEDSLFFSRMRDLSPLKRLPEPEEVCTALGTCIQNTSLTGTVLCVDAGLRDVY